MKFTQLSQEEQLIHFKSELKQIIKDVLIDPRKIKEWVDNNTIAPEEAISILKNMQSINLEPCSCCRTFDASKLNLSPLPDYFKPFIKITHTIVSRKNF